MVGTFIYLQPFGHLLRVAAIALRHRASWQDPTPDATGGDAVGLYAAIFLGVHLVTRVDRRA